MVTVLSDSTYTNQHIFLSNNPVIRSREFHNPQYHPRNTITDKLELYRSNCQST